MGVLEVLSAGLVLVLAMFINAGNAQSKGAPPDNCQRQCGNVSIPYPFGIEDGCYMPGFELTCNTSTTPPKPFLYNIDLMDIAISSGQLRILMDISYQCYNSSGPDDSNYWDLTLSEGDPYVFSYENNTFMAVGCDDLALINGTEGRSYTGGCLSVCGRVDQVEDGRCSGVGCCQAPIPKGLTSYGTSFESRNNHSSILKFNTCSYSFLVEKNNYTFRVSDLKKMDKKRVFPVVLDWSVGNQSCEQAKTGPDYACASSSSDCYSPTNGRGYLCRCSQGYQGNPYVHDGCQDIDECQNEDIKQSCKGRVCTNLIGTYSCSCPSGTHGNAADGVCFTDKGFPLFLKLVLGFGIGLPSLLVMSSCIYLGHQKRKLLVLKQNFFRQNGGIFLEQQISNSQSNALRIFTVAELEKATNNYDKQQILGKGGHGIVYKGVLEDKTIVAIKRSTMIDESRSKEFAKEMLVLSQINHINVVKLLGCCLEVEVPMLVYQLISKGTLFHFLHHTRHVAPISWALRLKIATESAKALAYLQSGASTTILHGDIKSSNILLDVNYSAKVSDFGTSTLAPKDKAQFMTLVQGTCGYLDPEYLQTCQLSEKSDVYSFGVVLAELLTRKKALYLDGVEGEKSLALNFISCVQNNRVLEILDSQIVDEESLKEIHVVVDLTVQCLSIKGDERPTMADISRELEGLRKLEKHPWVRHNLEEIEGLLDEQPNPSNFDTTGYPSSTNQTTINIDGGR